MDRIEWRRPMAPLLFVSDSSSESELSAADSKPPSTLRAIIIANRKSFEKKLLLSGKHVPKTS